MISKPLAAPGVTTFVDGLKFPEGPRWRDGALWFSDIHAHEVLRKAPAEDAPTVFARLDDRPSGLGFLPGGSLLVVSMLDRRVLRIDAAGRASTHADLATLAGVFINDMVVADDGRAYVGSRSGDSPKAANDSLILVEPDGRARVVVDDMVSPNGAVFTSDGAYLIIAETALGQLTRFRVASDGRLVARERFTRLEGRHIDGICLAPNGDIWAGGGSGGLYRIGADGALRDIIEFPGRMVLACALGGPGDDTLFLATTGQSLLDNLQHVGLERGKDASVNSGGRIETITIGRV